MKNLTEVEVEKEQEQEEENMPEEQVEEIEEQ